MTKSEIDPTTYASSTESAWEQIRELQITGRIHDPQVKSAIHEYLLACCRRIWFLLPESGSQEGVTIAENYCRGITKEYDSGRADYCSEASAFAFQYGETDDLMIGVYESRVIDQSDLVYQLLVPPTMIEERATARTLLTNAAFFAHRAVINMCTTKGLEKFSQFMPKLLFDDVVTNAVQIGDGSEPR